MRVWARIALDLRETGDPIHVRALASLLSVVVCKDLLVVDVMGAFVVPRGQFHMSFIASLPSLPPAAAWLWAARVLTLLAFGSALALLHARRWAAVVLLVAYGSAFLYEALNYASNLYLLLLLLGVCAIAPLRAPSVLWPRRLGQLTISAMYLGAGIGKLEPHFLSGQVLEDLLFHYWGHYPVWIGVRGVALFRALALLTVLTELGLSVALWNRRSARFAIWIGIAFHVAIDALMPVRIFSYVVIASYVLFLPAPTLERAYAWLDRHVRLELRAALCLLIATLFDLRDPFVALQPSAAAAALLAFAGYTLVRAVVRRRAKQASDAPSARRLSTLSSAGPWLVAGYLALQLFAIAKPALGYSKFFSWRMFSEVLTLRIDPQVLGSGSDHWKHAIFPDVQQRWSQQAFSYAWTSWGEEQFYLQGYVHWLEQEYRLAGQVRIAVAYTLFHGAEQRAIIGPSVYERR